MKLHTKTLLAALTAIAALSIGSTSNAAVIITPLDSTGFNSDLAIDGSGLSATVTIANAATVTHSVHVNTTNPTGAFAATTGVAAADHNFEMDLGVGTFGVGYDITGLYVWNYDQTTDGATDFSNRGVRTVNLGTQGTAGSFGGTYANQGALPVFLRANTDGSTATVSQFIDLSSLSLTGVRFLQFDITDWYGGTGFADGRDIVGLGEVRFVGTATPAPEPGSLALLGLGLVGLLIRARRRRSA